MRSRNAQQQDSLSTFKNCVFYETMKCQSLWMKLHELRLFQWNHEISNIANYEKPEMTNALHCLSQWNHEMLNVLNKAYFNKTMKSQN